ncbi:MAG: cytochrome c oxidase subunit VB-domain-containing protein [Piptocephalis tieghemiana]|nr:MAG: cytochrome c oxidase subunit VB-domain-containing protein [Piptocephalis tieghemiana]
MSFSTRFARPCASLLRQAPTRALVGLPARRAFSVLSMAREDKVTESLIGPGGKPGVVPTPMEQATGLERLEYLAEQKGEEFFDMTPLTITHMGTPQNPVLVKTVDEERYVACTGYPEESHEVTWLTVNHEHSHDRCPECGCAFKHQWVEGRPANHGEEHH